jgi:hypothetical protein
MPTPAQNHRRLSLTNHPAIAIEIHPDEIWGEFREQNPKARNPAMSRYLIDTNILSEQ